MYHKIRSELQKVEGHPIDPRVLAKKARPAPVRMDDAWQKSVVDLWHMIRV